MKLLNRILRFILRFIRGFISAIWQHARKDWPAALIVTALVTIVHLEFGWFDVIDRYAFVVLGHRSSLNTHNVVPHTVLVVIDEKTQVEGYLNRSPLDRCMLGKHLGLIYGTQPRLVVVDIDLSPALWIQQAASAEAGVQKRCEEDLHSLIESNGGKTVLMQPFLPPPTLQGKEVKALTQQLDEQKQWMERLKKPGVDVLFGDGMLPVERGAVYETLDSPDNLSRVALCKVAKLEASVNQKLLGFCKSERAKPIFLDFRQWIDSVGLSEPPAASIETLSPFTKNKVVFFGAHYGEQDQFLTLRKEMYGVDLHALGYVSGVNGQGVNMLEEHTDHSVKFVIDLIVAFCFGALIARYWGQYFKEHGSDSILVREKAFLQVARLGCAFLFLLYVCLLVSQSLLTSLGIWLSPVPIAIGILIESFSLGSLMEALELLHRPSVTLAMPGLPSPSAPTIQASRQASEESQVASQNRMQPAHPTPHSMGHAKLFRNFFWYDWRDPLKGSEPRAGWWILFRRVVWSLILGWAVWLMWFSKEP